MKKILLLFFLTVHLCNLSAQLVQFPQMANGAAGESFTAPTWLYRNSGTLRYYKADADTDTMAAVGVSFLTATTPGDFTQVYFSGYALDWPTALQPGATYYLSGTSGQMTVSRPRTGGFQELGFAADTFTFVIRITPWVNLSAPKTEIATFVEDDTYTIPDGAVALEIMCIGGGGGAGSGRRGAAGTVRCGGGGGGGGTITQATVRVADIGTGTLTVTVGLGGTGGAARTTNDQNGANGTVGGNTQVLAGSTVLCHAEGGNAGGGGTAAAGAAGAIENIGDIPGTAGGAANTSGGAGAGGSGATTTKGNTGGGAGGGISVANTANAGGSGGPAFFSLVTSTNRGTANNPGTIGLMADNGQAYGSQGGGGGGASITGAGGDGGNGIRGSGGGGGGAALNGNASGKGGNGGNGLVRIIAKF